MASGVKCSQEVMTRYNKLKKEKKTTFAVFGLNKKLDEIVVDDFVDSQLDAMASYKDLSDLLSNQASENYGQPRYIFYDVDYELPSGGGKRNKPVFISWCSDATAKMREKMVYAASKNEIKKLDSSAEEQQASDFAELANAVDEFVKEQIKKGR